MKHSRIVLATSLGGLLFAIAACSSSSPAAQQTSSGTTSSSQSSSSSHHSSTKSEVDAGEDGGFAVTGEWNGTVVPGNGATVEPDACGAVNACCENQVVEEDGGGLNPYCGMMEGMFTSAADMYCAMLFQYSLDYGYCPGLTYAGYTPVDYTQPDKPGDYDDAGAPDLDAGSSSSSSSTSSSGGGSTDAAIDAGSAADAASGG